MVRIARERVDDLFALAEREAPRHRELSDRYVRLARRIGMRYNIRLLAEYRELYCRGCSSYWVEGVSVRTRLRPGRRVRTCLVCGRQRRTRTGMHPRSTTPPALPGEPEPRRAGALADAELGEGEPASEPDESEEE